jgi:hypothetical protein
VVRLRVRRGGVPVGGILALLLAAAGSATSLLHLEHLGFKLCLFKLVTGWPCFTCGTTRALARLVELDLAGALTMNPLAALAALALAPWGALDLALFTRGRSLSFDVTPRGGDMLRLLAAVLLVANWAYLVAAGR